MGFTFCSTHPTLAVPVTRNPVHPITVTRYGDPLR